MALNDQEETKNSPVKERQKTNLNSLKQKSRDTPNWPNFGFSEDSGPAETKNLISIPEY